MSSFIRSSVPEIVSGYEVKRWEFSAIIPEASVNLITDPSFEIVTTGINTAVSSTLARSTTYQKRGAYSMAITPSSGVASGMYQSYALTGGLPYTYSLDLYGVPGQEYDIFFADNLGNIVSGVRTIRARGFWQRCSVMYQPASSATHRLYLRRKSYTSTAVFYTDGWQLEQKAYPTTYIDGDLIGFVTGQNAFYWNGTPHASSSTRILQTRAGGREMNLNNLVTILAIIGLGMSPVANIALGSSLGYSTFQDSFGTSRQFTIGAAIFGETPRELSQKRSELGNIFDPELTTPAQPMILRTRPVDCNGDQDGEALDINCSYAGGLEGGIVSEGQERVGLSFNMYLPTIAKEGSSGAQLGFLTTVTDFTRIGYRDTDGQWKSMGTGCNGLVTVLKKGPDGSIYAGGNFTLAGGVANTAYIAKWNGSAWQPLGTGMVGGPVWAIEFDAAGNLYAGGDFTSASGVANTARVAKWNGSAWSALGTGVAGSSGVYAMAFDSYGVLYIGGNFTSVGGVGANYVAKWNGSTWSALGSGAGGIVWTLVADNNGNVYVGGQFTTIDGVSATRIAKWNQLSFSALGSGLNNIPRTMLITPDGMLYVGGQFTTAGGKTVNYIAKWNGADWNPLNAGVDSTVLALHYSDGALYVGGEFNTIYGLTPSGAIALSDRMAIWNGNAWYPFDVDMTGTSAQIFAFETLNEKLYIGGTWTGTSAASATVATVNSGGVDTYPKIVFTGPGWIWQVKNYSTGKGVYFVGLTLMTGEIATLNLDPINLSFESNFRGNLMQHILPGNIDFYLQKGVNNISAYMSGTTASSSIIMQWQENYRSLDGR